MPGTEKMYLELKKVPCGIEYLKKIDLEINLVLINCVKRVIYIDGDVLTYI